MKRLLLSGTIAAAMIACLTGCAHNRGEPYDGYYGVYSDEYDGPYGPYYGPDYGWNGRFERGLRREGPHERERERIEHEQRRGIGPEEIHRGVREPGRPGMIHEGGGTPKSPEPRAGARPDARIEGHPAGTAPGQIPGEHHPGGAGHAPPPAAPSAGHPEGGHDMGGTPGHPGTGHDSGGHK